MSDTSHLDVCSSRRRWYGRIDRLQEDDGHRVLISPGTSCCISDTCFVTRFLYLFQHSNNHSCYTCVRTLKIRNMRLVCMENDAKVHKNKFM